MAKIFPWKWSKYVRFLQLVKNISENFVIPEYRLERKGKGTHCMFEWKLLPKGLKKSDVHAVGFTIMYDAGEFEEMHISTTEAMENSVNVFVEDRSNARRGIYDVSLLPNYDADLEDFSYFQFSLNQVLKGKEIKNKAPRIIQPRLCMNDGSIHEIELSSEQATLMSKELVFN